MALLSAVLLVGTAMPALAWEVPTTRTSIIAWNPKGHTSKRFTRLRVRVDVPKSYQFYAYASNRSTVFLTPKKTGLGLHKVTRDVFLSTVHLENKLTEWPITVRAWKWSRDAHHHRFLQVTSISGGGPWALANPLATGSRPKP
jgi:hypothetical protein